MQFMFNSNLVDPITGLVVVGEAEYVNLGNDELETCGK